MSDSKVTLHDHESGKNLDLPIRKGTYGLPLIEISSLPKKAGFFTFDPGFIATGSCESKITYLDGDKGELMYRGYPIEQLAEKCSFLEVFYLLLHGELPNADQKSDIEDKVTHHTPYKRELIKLFQRLPS